MPDIVLFDFDGVMVSSAGYWIAFQKTIQYFLELMGLDDRFLPDQEEIALLESQGVTGEWDMAPLTIATILETYLEASGSLGQGQRLPETFDWIKSHPLPAFRVDYRSYFCRVFNYVCVGAAVVENIYQACQGPAEACLFPHLAGKPILEDLFLNSRRVNLSWVTRVLQNYILGDTEFNRIYPDLPAFSSDCLLEKFDRVLISPQGVAEIFSAQQKGLFRACIMTARSSGSPLQVDPYVAGYSPEAEIGMRLAGLDKLPVVGYGSLLWAQAQYHLPVDKLLKPSAFQALAALATAWTGDVKISLDWAYRYFTSHLTFKEQQENAQTDLRNLEIPGEFNLVVFEDTPVGILAGIEAANLLSARGYKVNFKGFGIAQNENKRKALERTGAIVFDHIHQAFQAYLLQQVPLK